MNNFVEAFIAGLSPKERRILYITLGVVGLALFDRLILGPIDKESKAVDQAIEKSIIEIRKNNLILQYKDKIMKDNSDFATYYSKGNLSQEEQIAAFLSEVEDFAKASKIALTNMNPVTSEEKKGYLLYSLSIECASSMSNVLDFIYNIDNSKKPIRVLSYSILPKDRDNYNVKCTVTIIRAVIKAEAPAASKSEPVKKPK